MHEIEGRLCVPPLGRHTIVARDASYVGVLALWRVSRVVGGIRADTVSDVQPTVAGIGLYKIEGRLCMRHTIVARNVCYVDVRAVWRVSRVVSDIWADTVSDEQPHVDRLGL